MRKSLFFTSNKNAETMDVLFQVLGRYTDNKLVSLEKAIQDFRNILLEVQTKDLTLFLEEQRESKREFFDRMDLPFTTTNNPAMAILESTCIDALDHQFKAARHPMDKIKDMSTMYTRMDLFLEGFTKMIKGDDVNMMETMTDTIHELASDIEGLEGSITTNQAETRELESQLENKHDLFQTLTEKTIDVLRKPSRQLDVLLRLIEKLDAYNLNFTKHVLRLFHILTHGNRDYVNMRGNPLNYRETYQIREKLKEFVKDDGVFTRKYPCLSRFISNNLQDLAEKRNDAAHENPSPEDVIMADDTIHYPRVGKRDGVMEPLHYHVLVTDYQIFLNGVDLFSINEGPMVQKIMEGLNEMNEQLQTTMELAKNMQGIFKKFETNMLIPGLDKAIEISGFEMAVNELVNQAKQGMMELDNMFIFSLRHMCKKWNDQDERAIVPVIYLAKIAIMQDDMNEARRFAEKIMDLDQDNTNAWSILGLVDMLQGKYDDARDKFTRAIQACDKNEEAIKNLANVSRKGDCIVYLRVF